MTTENVKYYQVLLAVAEAALAKSKVPDSCYCDMYGLCSCHQYCESMLDQALKEFEKYL